MKIAPEETVVEMPDGRIIMPDQTLTLAELVAVLPVLLEEMGGRAALGPGVEVPLRGAPNAPGQNVGRPSPGFGPTSGPTGSGGPRGGGGFVASGGGGRGAKGEPGIQGPPGPGTIVPVVKTDGNFTVASISPFVPIPGTSTSITTQKAGAALFFFQGVFGGNSIDGVSNGLIGLRIDGVDQPLTANLIHTGAAGVAHFLGSVHASFPVVLSAGLHTVELVVRGDASLGAPTGAAVTVQANPSIPLALSIIHQ